MSDSGVRNDECLCMACGYSLKGHEGERLRCPECGFEQSAEEALSFRDQDEVDEAGIELQSVPAVGGGAVFLVLVGAVVGYWSVIALPLIPLGLSLWVYAAWRLGKSCGYRAGYLRALLWFQVLTVEVIAIVAVAVGVLTGLEYCAAKVVDHYSLHFWVAIAVRVGVALLLVCCLWSLVPKVLLAFLGPWIRQAVVLMRMQDGDWDNGGRTIE